MTDPQFKALAQLLRLRPGPAQDASRLVLVEGISTPDASRAVGMDYRAAHQAVKRARDGLALARIAVKSLD